MPSAGSGSAVSIVEPQEPEEALDADEADPGKVAEAKQQQVISKEGKYSATPVAAATASASESQEESQDEEENEEDSTHFVSFELQYEDGTPVPDEPYKVKLADGTIKTGKTDKEGKVRIDGVPNGKCEVNYPRIDKDQWRKA